MAVPASSLDLELIAQRILKLAEIATLDHLEALAQSQARELLETTAPPRESTRIEHSL